MSPVFKQAALATACAIMLGLLTRLLNHHLAVWQVHASVGGLAVAFPALRLHPKAAMWTAFCAGLAMDALTPVYFGQNALLMLAACSLIVGVRHRIPRDELPVGIAVAVIANLLLICARTVIFAPDWPDTGDGWLRVFSDLVASQLLIAAVTPWFFALQMHGLHRLGVAPTASSENT